MKLIVNVFRFSFYLIMNSTKLFIFLWLAKLIKSTIVCPEALGENTVFMIRKMIEYELCSDENNTVDLHILSQTQNPLMDCFRGEIEVFREGLKKGFIHLFSDSPTPKSGLK